MKENRAVVDLLAESLVRQDELNAKVDRLSTNMEALAENVGTLASAMMDFKEILASQSRSMETITLLMQEQRDDIRDIRYEMDRSGTIRESINSLNERVGTIEEKLEKLSQ